MEYREAKLNRSFIVKFDHGEDVLAGIKAVVQKEKIEAGLIFLVGALSAAKMVTGPERQEIPPEPHWVAFDDGREILAIGTIFREGDEPKLHLHSAAGRGDHTFAGCIRENGKVFLIVEAVILELTGSGAVREFDQASQLSLLSFRSTASNPKSKIENPKSP
ncbi:MAG: PPC domain-containing DNA-binding protein [Planctomycetota bacterium]